MAPIERPAAASSACWCGNGCLEQFDGDYSRCPACETIVFTGPLPPQIERADEDDRDLYSRSYWFERQEQVRPLE